MSANEFSVKAIYGSFSVLFLMQRVYVLCMFVVFIYMSYTISMSDDVHVMKQ